MKISLRQLNHGRYLVLSALMISNKNLLSWIILLMVTIATISCGRFSRVNHLVLYEGKPKKMEEVCFVYGHSYGNYVLIHGIDGKRRGPIGNQYFEASTVIEILKGKHSFEVSFVEPPTNLYPGLRSKGTQNLEILCEGSGTVYEINYSINSQNRTWSPTYHKSHDLDEYLRVKIKGKR